jgi:pyridinium-3,5-biscarboxylic acid mononucleotide synthase
VRRDGGGVVVSAGTADLPVAEEAAHTAEAMGAEVDRVVDVGVAGLHRVLAQVERIRAAHAVVVCAGMDGALPSVVGGLVATPVIAVPVSTGYGVAFGGVAALLAILNSCAAGVSAVNVDNGFGAGYQAALVARLAAASGRRT